MGKKKAKDAWASAAARDPPDRRRRIDKVAKRAAERADPLEEFQPVHRVGSQGPIRLGDGGKRLRWYCKTGGRRFACDSENAEATEQADSGKDQLSGKTLFSSVGRCGVYETMTPLHAYFAACPGILCDSNLGCVRLMAGPWLMQCLSVNLKGFQLSCGRINCKGSETQG